MKDKIPLLGVARKFLHISIRARDVINLSVVLFVFWPHWVNNIYTNLVRFVSDPFRGHCASFLPIKNWVVPCKRRQSPWRHSDLVRKHHCGVSARFFVSRDFSPSKRLLAARVVFAILWKTNLLIGNKKKMSILSLVSLRCISPKVVVLVRSIPLCTAQPVSFLRTTCN